MAEEIKLANIPSEVLAELIISKHSVDKVHDILIEAYPDATISRPIAREITKALNMEEELDDMSTAPSSPEVLHSVMDRELLHQIRRMTDENEVLRGIINTNSNSEFVIEGEKEYIDASQARRRMQENLRTMLDIKKGLTEYAKATASQEKVDINLNIGGLVSDALSNIKKNQDSELTSKVIDV